MTTSLFIANVGSSPSAISIYGRKDFRMLMFTFQDIQMYRAAV